MMSITANRVKLMVRISSKLIEFKVFCLKLILVEGVEGVEGVEVSGAFYCYYKLSNYII